MAEKNNAKITPVDLYISAGFNPKTGLPLRVDNDDKCELKSAIKKQLRVLDEQNAVNRYKWYNLPNGYTSQLIERMLYYKGQLMMFYSSIDDKFYILPYALSGEIDILGRYKTVSGLPFNGSTENKAIEVFTRDVIYDLEDITDKSFDEHCVLLKDYTEQIAQTIIPRQILQDPILDSMAEAFPLARTSLISNCGVRAMRVPDQDSYSNVEAAVRAIFKAAMTGKPIVPIVGPVDFQDLTNGSALKSEEYLLYMQAQDNYRLSLYGLDNGGLFQKKSHMLEAEQKMNNGNVGLIYQDGLTNRQHFCDMVNAVWGLGIWCEPSEVVLGVDADMNGAIMDDQDQSGIPGEQPEINEEVSNDD